ncbi:hypothetical protein A3B18_00225 [Candidatus Giovannonibacteria bacterium RIFCSPLOWO2_01_FULL_46_13]|uniref:Na+-translocating membrane potential-generating system MpsC domain-containing protein n=1 Tax=Candidatus Giovannonibacteria bacterium RIFCSPLOWO2_01_FULL_46_13 TaxID=1798352 RepID=A0A1F5X4M3_9BACT|nr:MAG: hypothetical protein A3B18_00225 [Candidatus Giovannonibacteria bacterium RIFCSPLOWO2_01_FULL_46_13]
MPLVEIRRNSAVIDDQILLNIIESLPPIAADVLSTKGGKLDPEEIMIEVDEASPFDRHVKDLNIRIRGHNFQERLENHDAIRRRISEEVLRHLPDGISWYVWLDLVPISYGSDTEP